MDEDWSLSSVQCYINGMANLGYLKDDIETLRKSVIEDILEESKLWWDYHIPKFQEDRNESLINKINKRFGYDG